MSLIYTFNYIEIDQQYIREHYNATSHMAYDNKIITPELELELDNTDMSVWDDSNPASLLGSFNWWGKTLTIYDTELERYVWDGVVKNIIVKDTKTDKTITLYSVSKLDDAKQLANIDDLTGKTPAEIIYDLLIQIGIDADYIVDGGFNSAIALQSANDVGIRIQYEDDDAVEVKSVIEELCEMTQCAVYSIDNMIHLYQWQEWDGAIGTQIKGRKVIEGSYSSEYKDDPIYNEYFVAYENAGSITFASGGVDADSQATHGRKVFSVPEGAFDDEDDPAEVNLLLDSKTGADWVGALAVSRYAQPRKQGKCKLTYDMDYVQLGDQIDLDFRNFSREPAKVLSKSVDRRKKEIKIDFEFLNVPVERYERDSTAPDPPILISAEMDGSTATLQFSKSAADDHYQYLIYFSSSPGNWEGSSCSQGSSPISCKETEVNSLGNIEVTLTRLTSANYSFYVSDVDTSYNESSPSNIITIEGEGGLSAYTPIDYTPDDEPVYSEVQYTDYLDNADYMPWIQEQDYTQWIQGATGAKGDTGATGATGAKGDKGDPGDNFIQDWITSTAYTADQVLADGSASEPKPLYRATGDYTSDATIADDIANGDLEQIGGTVNPFPIGSIYIQPASAASNTEATALPVSEAPAALFGGTWTELWNDECIALITQGDYHASEDQDAERTDGLQLDQIQGHYHSIINIPNAVASTQRYVGMPGTGGTTGFVVTSTGSQGYNFQVVAERTDGTHDTPRTGYATRPENRLMIIWKRTA